MQMHKVNPEYSLMALLMAAIAIVVFTPLCAVGLCPDETDILNAAREMSQSGIGGIFTPANASNFASSAYAYLVSVNLNVFCLGNTLAVRLPSAAIIWMLAIGLFRFRGQDERKDIAFLASLIFVSSYSVSALAYHASSLSLTALFLIASLSSLYHWIKAPSRQKSVILVAATVCATFFFGILSPIATASTGIIFLCIQSNRRRASFFRLIALMAASAVLAYLLAAFISNSTATAQQIIGIANLTEPIAEYSRLNILTLQLVLSIFPWSIPIIVALGWMFINPRWLKNRFLAMSLLKQFGVVVFVLTVPLITALNGMSIIMMLVTTYLNVPLIAHFLLSQTHNHSVTWRISGIIFASLIGLFAVAYIAAQFGCSITLGCYAFAPTGGWHIGAILLLVALSISLYSLTRNQRTIRFNNRYIYNIVILYLLAQILYKAYVNQFITLL